jgi:hypothetical protein
LIKLFKQAPADVSDYHIDDPDALGLALSVMQYDEVQTIDLSISLPILTAFKIDRLSADAIK